MKQKRYFILLVFLILPVISNSQPTKILYKQVVDLHASLSPKQQAFKAMLPEKVESQKEYYYVNRKALLKKVDEPRKSNQPSNKNLVMSISTGSEQFLIDYKAMKSYRLADILDEHFYVEYSLQQPKELEMTGETKKILGYTCKKAIVKHQGSEEEQIIWFTEELDFYASPVGDVYVKGAILELNKKETRYKAVNISKKTSSAIPNHVPERYRKITDQQYQDLLEEQLEKRRKRLQQGEQFREFNPHNR